MARVVIDKDGIKSYSDGYWFHHREDGPAIIYPNNLRYWFIEDVETRSAYPNGIYTTFSTNTRYFQRPDGFKRVFVKDASYKESAVWPEL